MSTAMGVAGRQAEEADGVCAKMNKVRMSVCAFAMLAVGAVRAEINTGLLEREAGFVGDEIGARVTDVDRSRSDVTVLDLSLPLLDESVDRVEVLDKDGRVVEQVQPARIEGDPEQNRLGVRLHLKRAPKMEFRLRLYEDSDEHVR